MYSSITDTEMKDDENIELNLVRGSNHTKKIFKALCNYIHDLQYSIYYLAQFLLLIKLCENQYFILNLNSSGCMALVSIMSTITQFYLHVSIFAQESNRAKQPVFPMATITVLNILSFIASV